MAYYKAFNLDLTCRNFQFEIGKTYQAQGDLEIYRNGFHCCKNALNCLNYYDENYRICEVHIGSEFITDDDNTVTRSITIVREVVGDELSILLTGFSESWNNYKWYVNGKLHREGDLPAFIDSVGSQYWFMHGKQHRDGDFPAEIHKMGNKKWYKNGKLHRENDLPAIIQSDGSEMWYKNGELHRENDFPAKIWRDGIQEWYKNGKRHRDLGPAIIDGYDREYYKDGVRHEIDN